MARKIVTPVEVQASVTGDQSVKSFRAQLREAQQEAIRLAQAVGQTSPEAIKAAQRVAELRDQMDDFNATVAGMHPDKFAVIGRIASTVANGFAAAQGAAALLGSESEDLQRTMVKVQAAMALAQGVESIKDLKFLMSGLRTFMLTNLVPAFTTVAGAARAVGAALGIGLIITAVTLLIQNFDKLISVFRKFANLPDHEKIKRQQEATIQHMEREIELMEAREATEVDIMKAKANAIVAERKMLRERNKLSEEEVKRYEDLGHELNVLLARAVAMRRNTEKAAADQITKDQQEAHAQRLKNTEDAERSNMEAAKRIQKESEAEMKRREDQRKKDEEQAANDRLAAAEKSRKELADVGAIANRIQAEQAKKLADEITAEEKKNAEDRIKIAQEVARLKQGIEQGAMASAEALMDIIGRQTAAAKGIALAQIAYDTGKAISGALAVTQSPSPDNVATGGLAGIAKYVAISAAILTNSARAIRIVKGGNASGGGGAGAPVSSGNIPQPSFNSSSLGGGTQFAGGYDNRVYVTEGDITNTQRRVRQNRGVSVI